MRRRRRWAAAATALAGVACGAQPVDAAWQNFEEDSKGSLEVGKLADLVWLDRNPLDAPGEIDQIRVLDTVVGGESVYSAADALAD